MARVASLTASILVSLAAATALGQSALEKSFRDPPREARPHTWWHWMNGNVTRAGITADLEAMKQIGLGGAQIFNVSEGIPEGPIAYNSDEWRG
ncbi:partial Putative beta-glucuronidase, partial [Anaerolineae bacterium]